MNDLRLTMNPADVAEMIGLPRVQAVRLMAKGAIRAVNVSGSKQAYWRTSKAAVEAYLRGLTAGSIAHQTTANGGAG